MRTARRARRRVRRRARHNQADRRLVTRDESGFSLVESMIALGVVFTVLLGLLASLNTGVRGLLTGRQRTGAIAVAKDFVERARTVAYDNLGHDFTNDTTLVGDPDVSGSSPNFTYQAEGVAAPESLVGVGANAPSWAVPHQQTTTVDGVTFTTRVYVTTVPATQGDDYKRLTIAVTWDKAQYASSEVSNEVRISSFVSRFGVVNGSEVGGTVDVDSGSVSVTGTLSGIDLSQATVFFPTSHGDATDDGLVRTAHGYASSARNELTLNSGTASGCTEDDDDDPVGATAACNGTSAQTAADNDAGTALALRALDGPTTFGGGTLSAGGVLTMALGSAGAAESRSAGEACLTCNPAVGDSSDSLVYGHNDGDGPSSADMGFVAGILSGKLFKVSSAGSALSTVDADAVAADQKIGSTGRLIVPAVDIVTLTVGPVGFTSGARVSAVDVTAAAEAGPTAVAPSVSSNAGAIQVTLYDTNGLGLPYYRTLSFNPGDVVNDASNVTFDVPIGLTTARVTLATTVTTGSESTESQSSGGAITSASASLSNWFVVQTQMTIVQGGQTLADLTIEVDYGRLATTTQYEAA